MTRRPGIGTTGEAVRVWQPPRPRLSARDRAALGGRPPVLPGDHRRARRVRVDDASVEVAALLAR